MAHISAELNSAFNEHLGREFASSHQYINMAAYFDDRALGKLAKMFFTQAEEEREHGMKFIRYLNDVGGSVQIPAIEAPQHTFQSVEEVAQLALKWEMDITARINKLLETAISQKDYAAQEFLKWFVTEQIEEVRTMEDLLKVVQVAGERSIIMVEAYLVHNDL